MIFLSVHPKNKSVKKALIQLVKINHSFFHYLKTEISFTIVSNLQMSYKSNNHETKFFQQEKIVKFFKTPKFNTPRCKEFVDQ